MAAGDDTRDFPGRAWLTAVPGSEEHIVHATGSPGTPVFVFPEDPHALHARNPIVSQESEWVGPPPTRPQTLQEVTDYLLGRTPAPDNLEVGMDTNGDFDLSRVNLSSTTLVPGDDLRDFVGGPAGSPLLPVLVGASILVPRLAGPLVARAMTFFRGAGAAGGRLGWGSLPGWLQTGLVAAGATVGIDILLDLPGEIVPGGIVGGFGGDNLPVHATQGMPGAHVVGQWVANGVTFYRLADGRLAVQNKHGRWKVWKPKKPIVIMPTGAGNLRTLLKADAVLNRQAKRIAAMLNRRVGSRTRKAAAKPAGVVVMPAESTRIIQT